MQIISFLPLLVAVSGLVLFLLSDASKNPDRKKVGEILFWTGTLVFLASNAQEVLTLRT